MPVLPRGRLDQHGVRLDRARGLQGLDHRDADAVLDADERVEELELDQDVGLDAALRRPGG